MDSRQNSQYLVGVGQRMLLWLALGALVAGTIGAPAAATDTLEFDVEQARLDAHDAQLLLNLNTDNIEHESVTESWNSLYKREPGTVSGRFVADMADGSFSGQLVETWSCSECRTEDGQESWATNQAILIKATVGGNLTPDGSAWRIDGSAEVAYEVDIKADESPSICGNEPCWICKNRVCEVGEQMSAQASVEGWIQGDTLALMYTDRLLEDTDQMDFSEIRRTQFIMSRFAIQITGTVPPPAAEEPSEPSEPLDDAVSEAPDEEAPAEDATPADAAAVDVPAPAADEASPDDASEAAEPDRADSDVAAPAAGSSDDGGLTKSGLFIAIMIICVLLFGVGFLVLLKPELFWGVKPPPAFQPSPDPMFDPRNLEADPGNAPPLENALDKPPPPAAAGAGVQQFSRTPDERSAGLGPVHQLVATDGSGRVHGKRKGTPVSYLANQPVFVVGKAGHSVKIQLANGDTLWVDEENVVRPGNKSPARRSRRT